MLVSIHLGQPTSDNTAKAQVLDGNDEPKLEGDGEPGLGSQRRLIFSFFRVNCHQGFGFGSRDTLHVHLSQPVGRWLSKEIAL